MKLENNWRNKNLEILENEVWDDSDIYPSYLVKRCHVLRKMPIGDFTIEDLRIMIGQQIGLKYLIPLAIEQLTQNLFAEGHHYPGDLLKNVLNVDHSFWKENVNLWDSIHGLIKNRISELKDEDLSPEKFYSANK